MNFILSIKDLLSRATIGRFFFLLIISASSTYPQSNAPKFCVDIARFRVDDNTALVEFHYDIARNSLTFQQQDSVMRSDCQILTFVIENSAFEDSLCYYDEENEKVVAYRKRKLHVTPLDTLYLEDEIFLTDSVMTFDKLVEKNSARIKKGFYEVIVVLRDLISKQISVVQRSIEVIPFLADKVQLSDIELAYSIEKTNSDSTKFDKWGYRIYPNSCLDFGGGFSKIFVYCEIYGLSRFKNPPVYNFDIRYLIRNGRGEIIKQLTRWNVQSDSKFVLATTSFDISDLTPDIYRLEIEVEDNKNNKKAQMKKAFYISEFPSWK